MRELGLVIGYFIGPALFAKTNICMLCCLRLLVVDV